MMTTKLTKKKVDVSFLDPVTMQVVCTFNQCVNKFTKEDFEVVPTKNGKEFVQYFHVCEECGRRVQGKGDTGKAYQKWLELQQAKDFDSLDQETQAKIVFHKHNFV